MFYKQDFRDYSLYMKVNGQCKNGHYKTVVFDTIRSKTYRGTCSDLKIWTPCLGVDIPLKAVNKMNAIL